MVVGQFFGLRVFEPKIWSIESIALHTIVNRQRYELSYGVVCILISMGDKMMYMNIAKGILSALLVGSFLGCDDMDNVADQTSGSVVTQTSRSQLCSEYITTYKGCLGRCLDQSEVGTETQLTCLDECIITLTEECRPGVSDLLNAPSTPSDGGIVVSGTSSCQTSVSLGDGASYETQCSGNDDSTSCQCLTDGVVTSTCTQSALSCPGCCEDSLSIDMGDVIDININVDDVIGGCTELMEGEANSSISCTSTAEGIRCDCEPATLDGVDDNSAQTSCDTTTVVNQVSMQAHCEETDSGVTCLCIQTTADGVSSESSCTQDTISCPGCCGS